MSIPKWNSEWERPDPLRGARGWVRHHFASVGVAAILICCVLGLLVPAVTNARRKQYELDRANEQLQAAFGAAAGAWSTEASPTRR